MSYQINELERQLSDARTRIAGLEIERDGAYSLLREAADENAALQETLDRVTAIAEHWADCGIGSCSDSLAALFAALTPEGKREGEKAMPDKTEGLIHNKFYVQRTDNETNRKHDDCRYFVLDPQHDRLALFALATYAHEALDAGYTALGNDLIAWVRQIEDAETLEGKP